MTTLYHFASPVKPARRFGAGLLRSLPTYRADHTASDAAWWAAECARLEDARLDQRAAESAAMDRMEAGMCC